MAIQFVNNVDFNANQAQSIRIENVSTDPSTELVLGRIIFNTTADTLKQYVADDGSGNPGWVEVGSTTVKAGTGIGVTFANGEATVRNTGLVSVLDGTFIDLTKQGGGDNTELTADLSAAGTPDATKYLRGDNTWSPISGIYDWTIAGDTGSETIVNGDTVTFAGDTNITTAYDTGNNTLSIDLDDSITLAGTLGVTGTTTLGAVDILGDVDMNNGQINNLGNGTASSDAVNLGQVQSLVAGVGVFQGGYDATNDPGSPNISGSSNVALDTGDFYVVTVDGDITFSDQTVSVEVGDLIFANTDISANSNPASTDYTFVIQDQNIAGEGATDAATEKGVAGFNSAHFSVTANGWVSAEIATAGSIGIGNVAASTNVEYDGLRVDYSAGTATVGLDIASIPQVTSTPSGAGDAYFPFYDDGSSENKAITLENLAAEIDISKGVRISLDGSLAYVTRTEAGGLTTFAVAVNNGSVLSASSALDVKAEITTAAGQTVYADVTRSGTTLSVIFTGSVANGTYSALLVDVG